VQPLLKMADVMAVMQYWGATGLRFLAKVCAPRACLLWRSSAGGANSRQQGVRLGIAMKNT